MTNFEDLERIWHGQAIGDSPSMPNDVIAQAGRNKREMVLTHVSTIAILSGVTVMIFLYFFLFNSRQFQVFSTAVLLMCLALVFRIGFEVASYWQFKKVDITADFNRYIREITHFYAFRRRIQYFITPLSMLCYTSGLVIFVAKIYAHVSPISGFFTITSGIGLLCFIIWIIVHQTRRETELLNFLMDVEKKLQTE